MLPVKCVQQEPPSNPRAVEGPQCLNQHLDHNVQLGPTLQGLWGVWPPRGGWISAAWPGTQHQADSPALPGQPHEPSTAAGLRGARSSRLGTFMCPISHGQGTQRGCRARELRDARLQGRGWRGWGAGPCSRLGPTPSCCPPGSAQGRAAASALPSPRFMGRVLWKRGEQLKWIREQGEPSLVLPSLVREGGRCLVLFTASSFTLHIPTASR